MKLPLLCHVGKCVQYLSRFGDTHIVPVAVWWLPVFDKLRRQNPTNSCKPQRKLHLLFMFRQNPDYIHYHDGPITVIPWYTVQWYCIIMVVTKLPCLIKDFMIYQYLNSVQLELILSFASILYYTVYILMDVTSHTICFNVYTQYMYTFNVYIHVLLYLVKLYHGNCYIAVPRYTFYTSTVLQCWYTDQWHCALFVPCEYHCWYQDVQILPWPVPWYIASWEVPW